MGAPFLSIVVPIYNEERVIDRLLDQLRPLRETCEVILVDGGSTDGTLARIDDAFTVIRAPKGRGGQLNAGARAATGAVLLFLHADSVLPPDPVGEVERVMRTHRVGCFGVRFEPSSPLMRICAALSNFRCYVRRIMFGDQGIFIERALFLEVSGFPDLPLMEDYRFSLDLRRRGLRPGATRGRITTSARRFGTTTRSRLRTMMQMAHLRRLYRRGASIEEIARRYGEAR